MGTLTITTRKTSTGPRYIVRYRLGGRAYPVQHGGSFRTLKEAKARRDLIGGEIAAGRNPADTLLAIAVPVQVRTFATIAEAYRESRVDLAPQTLSNLKSHLRAILPVFGDRDAETITPSDVQAWIACSTLQPASLRRYLVTLRGIFEYAGVDPNPARDPRVRLSREEHVPVDPPTGADVELIVGASPPRWRLALRTLAETGMRVGELHSLEWQDVEPARSRFRIRNGKSAAARRWVVVPEELMTEITDATPPDDRTAERRVFPGATPHAVKHVIAKACKSAGIRHYHPHDLRHRYASVQIMRGVPVTLVAAQLGHSKNSMTLDTYSHVLVDNEHGAIASPRPEA
jgi:integrase